MKKSILVVSVLTLTLLGALSAGSPAEARRCPFDMCVTLYNECEASCSGNRQCVKACRRDYNECLCSNCGFSCGELPRSAPKARTSSAAVGGVMARGYTLKFTADALFQGEQAVP